MASTEPTIFVVKGDDYAMTLTVQTEAGAPVDLTGFTWAGAVCTTPGATPVAAFTFETSNQADGEIVARLTNGQTALLSPDVLYYYDLRARDPGSLKTTYARGRVHVYGNCATV